MRSINPALFLAKTKKVSVTRNFVADTAVDPIDLELPGYYCDIVVKFLLNVTTPSTDPEDPNTDWHARVIDNLEIEASNMKPYLEHDDGRYLRYENLLRSHGAVTIPTLPLKNLTGDVRWQIHIHPGDSFLDPFDISDVIAKRGLSNLVFKLTWGAGSDIGVGYQINSGTVELIINYVVLQPGISEVRAFPGTALPGRTPVPSFWQPQWRIVKFRSITSTYGNLSYEENFLNGFFLRYVLMLVKDSSDALVNNVITEVQITNKEGFEYFNKDFTDILEDNMREYELTARLTGVALLDLREIFQKTKAGLYMANAEDLKWHFTVENVTVGTPAEVALVYLTHFRSNSLAKVIGQTPAEFAV